METNIKLFPTFEEFKELNEANLYYKVEYYDPDDEIESIGTYKDFKTALRKAEDLKNDSLDDLDKSIWYIGVHGDGDEFAIVYASKKYLNTNIFSNSKKDDSFQVWKTAVEKCIKTKKTVIGKYEN